MNEEWSDSEFKMYHIADALRLVILSRWGGVYLDTGEMNVLGRLNICTSYRWNILFVEN